MRKGNMLNKLRSVQREADDIRAKLSISSPAEVIYKAELDLTGDETLLVEANGFGGALTKIVKGNYPIDYYTKFEEMFERESEAVAAAESILERELNTTSAHSPEQH